MDALIWTEIDHNLSEVFAMNPMNPMRSNEDSRLVRPGTLDHRGDVCQYLGDSEFLVFLSKPR